ncbi:MAG: hypothetical protein ACRDMH_02505 [Solirubrobacterales bacterium]
MSSEMTIEQARQLVEQGWEQARERALQNAALGRMNEHNFRIGVRKADERRAREAKAEAEREQKALRKAWVKERVMSKAQAARVDFTNRYDLHESDAGLIAFGTSEAQRAARDAGTLYIAPHPLHHGIDPRGFGKFQLVGVDPTGEELRPLAERIAAEEAERERRAAERAEAQREAHQREHELARYGVPLSDA